MSSHVPEHTADFAELHDELRAVARDLLGSAAGGELDWDRVVAAGWTGLEVPEALDGAGATFAETAVVLEEMGRVAATSPYLGSVVLGAAALTATTPAEGASDDAGDRLLRGIAAGEVRVAVALTPTGDDLLAEPPFRIEGQGSGARLQGRAEFVIDAPLADHLLLLATTPDGTPVLALVDAASVEVEVTPVLDATRRFGTVVAEVVALDASSIRTFRGEPRAASQQLVDRAAVAIAVDSFGLASAMLDATVDYVGARRQFDRPIGSFQVVKHACADMHVHLSVGRELLRAAVAAVASLGPGDTAPEAAVAVARAKSYVCATAVEVVGGAMQLHGGIGYTWESGIHVHLKRAVLDRALVGSPAAHRRRLAGTIRRVEK